MDDSIVRVRDLQSKREASEGKRIHDILNEIEDSFYAVNRNFSEFFDFNEKFECDIEIFQHGPEEFFRKSEECRKEFVRLIQNYVESVCALIDHERRFVRLLRCSLFEKEYNQKISTWGANSSKFFVEDLRNYIHHRRLPWAPRQFYTEINHEKGELTQYNKMFLKKNELLEGEKWSKQSKEFLCSAEIKVYLKPILEKYQENLVYIYNWIIERINEIYVKEFTYLNEIETQLNELYSMGFC